MKKYAQSFVVFLFLFDIMDGDCAYAADCNKLNSEVEMRQCVKREYNLLDEQLNKVYSEYRVRLDAGQKQQLKEAQVAWLKYRDRSCDFEASGVKGGSAYPMIYTLCLSQKTRARINEIENLVTCEEGDLSCPRW